jgi:hypothetical protein
LTPFRFSAVRNSYTSSDLWNPLIFLASSALYLFSVSVIFTASRKIPYLIKVESTVIPNSYTDYLKLALLLHFKTSENKDISLARQTLPRHPSSCSLHRRETSAKLVEINGDALGVAGLLG